MRHVVQKIYILYVQNCDIIPLQGFNSLIILNFVFPDNYALLYRNIFKAEFTWTYINTLLQTIRKNDCVIKVNCEWYVYKRFTISCER